MIKVKDGYWELDDKPFIDPEQSPAELLKEVQASSRIERRLGQKIMQAFKDGKELAELSVIFSIERSTILAHLRNQGEQYMATCCERLFNNGKTINEIVQLTGLTWDYVYNNLSEDSLRILKAIVLDLYEDKVPVARIRSSLELPRHFCYQLLEDMGIDIVSILEGKLNGIIEKHQAQLKH